MVFIELLALDRICLALQATLLPIFFASPPPLFEGEKYRVSNTNLYNNFSILVTQGIDKNQLKANMPKRSPQRAVGDQKRWPDA
jgi:hypothetical protein